MAKDMYCKFELKKKKNIYIYFYTKTNEKRKSSLLCFCATRFTAVAALQA